VTVDQALELFRRAENAQDDYALKTVLEWMGWRMDWSAPSLQSRLEFVIMATWLIPKPKPIMRAIGQAFADADMVAELREYLSEELYPSTEGSRCEPQKTPNDLIAECFRDKPRKGWVWTAGFIKWPYIGYPPCPAIALGARLPGEGLTATQQPRKSEVTHIFGRRQSAADGKAAWGRNAWDRDAWQCGAKSRRPWGRDTAKLCGGMQPVCDRCKRFAQDCVLISSFRDHFLAESWSSVTARSNGLGAARLLRAVSNHDIRISPREAECLRQWERYRESDFSRAERIARFKAQVLAREYRIGLDKSNRALLSAGIHASTNAFGERSGQKSAWYHIVVRGVHPPFSLPSTTETEKVHQRAADTTRNELHSPHP
jgi:hypothetical protein